MRHDQGDQTGRIFGQWMVVYFGQWFENYRSSAHFWATFFHGTSSVLILKKKRLGYILAEFFTNSCGNNAMILKIFLQKIVEMLAFSLCDLNIDPLGTIPVEKKYIFQN
jgi:hypothetical protein